MNKRQDSFDDFIDNAPSLRRDGRLDRSELRQIWEHGFYAAARFVEKHAEKVYPRDIFLPIPEEAKAKDAVAADLLREMYPRLASAMRDELDSQRG